MNKDFSRLNNDQAAAAGAITNFLKDPNTIGEVFTLTGGPGTGKTFMLREVLDDYKGAVQGATVSHAAKNVLQESIGHKVQCTTFAKLLDLKQDISPEGQISFRVIPGKTRSQMGGEAKLLIGDEVSQIPDTIHDIIRYELKTHGIRMIAVGDPYQLPPVEQETDSKFFNRLGATLIQPMRFQGPITELAEIYREQIDHINNETGFSKWALNDKTHRKDKFVDNTGYGFTNRLDAIIDMAGNDIKSHPEDLSYARVLAFKNESVSEINERIRHIIYGSRLEQFERNELVICNGGYTAVPPDLYSSGRNKKVSILYNGQALRVAASKEVDGPEGVPCMLMGFYNYANAEGIPIFTVRNDPTSQQIYTGIRDKLAKEAKDLLSKDKDKAKEAWKRYYNFVESFAYFDYGYSVTNYKAQGQTLTNVYVCEGEIMDVKPLTWKQKFQALYVAMTRAKEKLYIYNKEF